MRKLLFALLATSTLAVAAPALAHEDGGDDWATSSYDDFNPMYQHIWQGIQHGLSDGSYTPWQARRFYRELQSIRARAAWEDSRGDYDPDEINQRLESLHVRMHIAHDQGHARMNNDWYGYRGGYNGGGYNGGGYNGGYNGGDYGRWNRSW